MLIPYPVVEKILLDIPNSAKRPDFSDDDNIVFKIDNIVVVVPNTGIQYDHLEDILQSQLGMAWWMIDYILGENGIQF